MIAGTRDVASSSGRHPVSVSFVLFGYFFAGIRCAGDEFFHGRMRAASGRSLRGHEISLCEARAPAVPLWNGWVGCG